MTKMTYKTNNKSFKMECYICTDITEERSPCECKAPVHMKCLEQWIKKLDNNRLVCSICNRELQGVTIENIEIDFDVDVPDSTVFKPCKFLCNAIYYLLLGYIGKIIFALIKNPILMTYSWFWFPFDIVQLTCTCFMMLIISLFKPLALSVCEYIRACKDNNYEEFVDSDSDSDSGHNQESVV